MCKGMCMKSLKLQEDLMKKSSELNQLKMKWKLLGNAIHL